MTSSKAQHMVRLIRNRGVRDQRVLDAMLAVPRDRFVPEPYKPSAYRDTALSIGHGQTISQPYIVALMTEALDLGSSDRPVEDIRVLEIGTGSGYQSAVLAEMGMHVYSVETVQELQQTASRRIKTLGYTVQHRLGDGYEGWPEHAPYAGIIVTAAATKVPPPLLEQLDERGRLVIPVGPPGGRQILWKFINGQDGMQRINLGAVSFVPFVSPRLSKQHR